MRKIWILLLCLGLLPIAYAKDITLSVNQSEYYVAVGQQAVIPLNYENTYQKQIEGTLSYTITQEINQQGFQYRNTNAQSTSFAIPDQTGTLNLNFGSSDSPVTLTASIKFQYTEDGPKAVDLGDIIIHFVQDPNQQKQQSQGKSAQSQDEQKAEQNERQKQIEEQMKQMNDIFNQRPPQQSPNQRAINNQVPQDSSALQQEIAKQLQDKKEEETQFKNELGKQEEVRAMHEQLLQKGYNITNANVQSASPNSGSFELQYQNQQGEQATVKGKLENGSLTEFNHLTPEDKQKMMQQLSQNKEFQKFENGAKNEGYKPNPPSFEMQQNQTKVSLAYQNPENKTAQAIATFHKQNLTNLELQKGEKSANFWFLWMMGTILIVGILAGYWLKKRKIENPMTEQAREPPFDYEAEAKKLLQESKRIFTEKKHKDAYGKAAQALRLYLSYKHNLRKELTNYEVVRVMKKEKYAQQIKECFDLCNLVEFAKYQANDPDFKKIIELAEEIIR